MTDPYPTHHLLEKMKGRDISWKDIVAVIETADVVYGPDHKGRYVHQKGNLSVVATREGAVITALLKRDHKWDDKDARGRETCRGYFKVPKGTVGISWNRRCDNCGVPYNQHS